MGMLKLEMKITVCSKSCYIEIENSMYLVLWEFRLSETVMVNATAEDTDYLLIEE